MKKYQENRKYKDDLYAQETEERKKKAREENQRRKFYQPRTDEEEKEAEQKIRELREIVDEKDRRYAKLAGNDDGPEGAEGDSVPHPIGGEGEKTDASGLMAGLDDSKFADPWMQKRHAASQGKNFETGSAQSAPSVEEKDKILSNIVKDIF